MNKPKSIPLRIAEIVWQFNKGIITEDQQHEAILKLFNMEESLPWWLKS
jgi:hypothetical protein